MIGIDDGVFVGYIAGLFTGCVLLPLVKKAVGREKKK